MGSQYDERDARELQSFLEMENQKAVIQAAIGKLSEICFDKCVVKPGNKLDSSEANCISNCAGRYLDTSMFIMNRMVQKK
jgi:import inner membrane translocase subunit TIM8